MGLAKALFTSAKDDWETPDELFAWWHRMCNFTVDAAASSHNAKLARYWSKEDDGLTQSWAYERVWCNPPYGRQIEAWIQKAAKESTRAMCIVMLVPACTDTRWWHEWAITANPHFVKGRLKFKGAKHSAPFPSVILRWGYLDCT